MNMLENLQTDFLSAIYGAPDFNGIKAGFAPNLDIYRNNLLLGLLENLRTKFPTCETLLGEEFFRSAVCEFIELRSLQTGHNNDFGEDFAEFLRRFLEPEFTFVAKIAEIEWAKFCAETAPNLKNADFDFVANSIANGEINFELHPSFSIVTADFNAFEIYFAHENQKFDVALAPTQQKIAIWRDKDFDPCLKLLDDFEFAFVSEIQNGNSILEAIETAINRHGQTEENQMKFVSLCNSGVLKI